ncbi:hypothetical protein NUW54_g12618 [Trametes sanguinea]|uniref:Uncharacterized protein n=1 Tax=Trametes sanguinea TaxID=158606 RepID=A0ACC1MXL4_9APHY|nr:hypothetical protein NUW54_g12618 [Trametes sanguinea]
MRASVHTRIRQPGPAVTRAGTALAEEEQLSGRERDRISSRAFLHTLSAAAHRPTQPRRLPSNPRRQTVQSAVTHFVLTPHAHEPPSATQTASLLTRLMSVIKSNAPSHSYSFTLSPIPSAPLPQPSSVDVIGTNMSFGRGREPADATAAADAADSHDTSNPSALPSRTNSIIINAGNTGAFYQAQRYAGSADSFASHSSSSSRPPLSPFHSHGGVPANHYVHADDEELEQVTQMATIAGKVSIGKAVGGIIARRLSMSRGRTRSRDILTSPAGLVIGVCGSGDDCGRDTAAETANEPTRDVVRIRGRPSSSAAAGARDAIETVSNGTLAMIAGSDTTSIALSNLFYFVLSDPDVYARLRVEVDRFFPPGEDPLQTKHHATMPFLNAVM